MGGLFGAVIVDGMTLPSPLNTLQKNLLVLHHVAPETTSTGNWSVVPLSYKTLSGWSGSTLPIQPEYVDSTITDHYLINGAYQPFVTMSPGEMKRLDLVHCVAGPYRLELELWSGIGSGVPSQECSMYLIALDGVYLSEARQIT